MKDAKDPKDHNNSDTDDDGYFSAEDGGSEGNINITISIGRK